MGQLVKSYGLKIGMIAATQSYDYHDHPTLHGSLKTSYRWGFAVGGEVGFVESSLINIATEVLYVQKGYSIQLENISVQYPEGTGELILLRPRADYISIAPVARVRVMSAPPHPYALVEPRLDFLIGKDNLGLDLNSLDAGATVGIGVEFSLALFPGFFVEGRFSPSFTNAFRGQYLTVRNRSFEILTGLRF